MATDTHGNAVTVANLDSVTLYDQALDHLLHFRPEVSPSLETLITQDPRCVMGQVAAVYLGILGTEPADTATARSDLTAVESSIDVDSILPRERMHLAAAHSLVHGDLHAGGAMLRNLSVEHPRDALALAVGHQIDFFTGDASTLRDRVGGALSAWTADDPHYAQMLGMYSFGLEECGMYSRAEDAGLESVERDPSDVWGIHAVAHTLEMQGRISEGLSYLDEHASDWQQGNYLNVHNAWHYCLYLMDSGDFERPLSIYDAVLNNAESAGLAMEMLDAAALLWRMYLEGQDQTARWTVLADSWTQTMKEPLYAFNDMHAVMSFVGAGRVAEAERLVESRERYVAKSTDPSVTNIVITKEIGLPVDRALIAFGKGDYVTTLDLLQPIRYSLPSFGGSHAQRDAVQRTILEAALRSDRHDIARTLLSERLAANPCSPYGWLKQAALARAVGDAVSATTSEARLVELRATSAART
ncbi:MAG: tetratricopeptide repeat protein [Actinomycetes bacterium]